MSHPEVEASANRGQVDARQGAGDSSAGIATVDTQQPAWPSEVEPVASSDDAASFLQEPTIQLDSTMNTLNLSTSREHPGHTRIYKQVCIFAAGQRVLP
jgi:hypothetical protein